MAINCSCHRTLTYGVDSMNKIKDLRQRNESLEIAIEKVIDENMVTKVLKMWIEELKKENEELQKKYEYVASAYDEILKVIKLRDKYR